MDDLATCFGCGEPIEPGQTVDTRHDVASDDRVIFHMECTKDGVKRALRLNRTEVPAEPGSWDEWNDEEGAQSLLGGLSSGIFKDS